MTRVVLLRHAGVSCALPAKQVLESRRSEAPSIDLFGVPEEEVGRELVVETAVGRRRIDCSTARFDHLGDDQLRALPELLREKMNLPHVVGLADAEEKGLHWLIDLSRWRDE